MCFILHFVIIAFAYNAFYLRLVSARLISYILHNFFSSDGRIIINFAFRDDIFKISIFRRSTRFIKDIYVNPLKALSVNLISY